MTSVSDAQTTLGGILNVIVIIAILDIYNFFSSYLQSLLKNKYFLSFNLYQISKMLSSENVLSNDYASH